MTNPPFTSSWQTYDKGDLMAYEIKNSKLLGINKKRPSQQGAFFARLIITV
ncbi:hypothetical protein GE573_02684 [Bacillus velezensis]|nr:hypothetical protein GE573_02684 [Bacillus velezensis]